jgi:hypothetical protein
MFDIETFYFFLCHQADAGRSSKRPGRADEDILIFVFSSKPLWADHVAVISQATHTLWAWNLSCRKAGSGN